MLKTNIVLIGMPGAGKSTLGVLLAKSMKMPFIDTDLLIQQQKNKYLQDIINEVGIKGFIKLEEKVILSLKCEEHLIATGGSVIYSSKSTEYLKNHGIVVYLKLRYDEIEQRINNITSRGIAIETGQTLNELYKERTKLYEQNADIIIDCSDKYIEDLVSEIKGAIGEFKLVTQ